MQRIGRLFWIPFLLASACSSQPARTGQSSARVANATDLGRVSPDTVLRFVIGLELAQPARLRRFLNERTIDGPFLTPDEFAERFAPSAAEYRRVTEWLTSAGLQILRVSDGRTTITVQGTAAQIDRALKTELHRYTDSVGDFVAVPEPPRFPSEVSGSVSSVVGLEGAPPWRSRRQSQAPLPALPATVTQPSAIPQAPPPDPGNCTLTQTTTFPPPNPVPPGYKPVRNYGLQPSDLQKMYGETGVATPGAGQSIAILGTGFAPDPIRDVEAYANHYALGVKIDGSSTASTTNQYVQTFLGGYNRDDFNFAANEYAENVLDIDMVFALAPASTVYHVLTATNLPGLFTDGVSYIVNQLPQVHSVSVSYGTCERGSAGEMTLLNTLFAQAQAEGQQWFFATDDTGSDGCGDSDPSNPANKVVSAGWPASSPYVVSVGGSSFLDSTLQLAGLNDATANERKTPVTVTVTTVEHPWILAGAAPSESFDKPAFQMNVGPQDQARDTPDVSAFADSTPGVCTVSYLSTPQNSGRTGGTSAATPIWAAVWAVLNQAYAAKHPAAPLIKNGLPLIYAIGAGVKGTNVAMQPIKDLTSGGVLGPDLSLTDGYSAGPGFDMASGWGTPNVAQLISVLP
jgi:kumamolisin